MRRQEAALAAGATLPPPAPQTYVFSVGGSHPRLTAVLGGEAVPAAKARVSSSRGEELVCCHLLLKAAQSLAGLGEGGGMLQPADPQKADSALAKELRLHGGSVENKEQQ